MTTVAPGCSFTVFIFAGLFNCGLSHVSLGSLFTVVLIYEALAMVPYLWLLSPFFIVRLSMYLLLQCVLI